MMKASLRTLVLVSAVLLAQYCAPVYGFADANDACSKATLHGSYAFTESGTIVDIGPVAVAGVFQADGNGNLIANDTVSLDGEIVQETLNFTYQVNADCTGSASSVPGQEPAHFNFVIVNFGEEVTGIHTGPGTTLILKAKQQFSKRPNAARED
jgi:hypothetical protein